MTSPFLENMGFLELLVLLEFSWCRDVSFMNLQGREFCLFTIGLGLRLVNTQYWVIKIGSGDKKNYVGTSLNDNNDSNDTFLLASWLLLLREAWAALLLLSSVSTSLSLSPSPAQSIHSQMDRLFQCSPSSHIWPGSAVIGAKVIQLASHWFWGYFIGLRRTHPNPSLSPRLLLTPLLKVNVWIVTPVRLHAWVFLMFNVGELEMSSLVLRCPVSRSWPQVDRIWYFGDLDRLPAFRKLQTSP